MVVKYGVSYLAGSKSLLISTFVVMIFSFAALGPLISVPCRQAVLVADSNFTELPAEYRVLSVLENIF